MAKNPENTEDTDGARVQYPYCTLQKSLEGAIAIRDLGGVRASVQKSVLAHHLGVEEGSPAFKQLIGSMKAFGLVAGRGAYTLTELAKEYFFPTDDQQRRRALLKAVRSPVVFGALIDRFDGNQVPNNNLLGNVLHRDFRIAPSWAPRVATLFLGALRIADAVDAGGRMRYDSTFHKATVNDGDSVDAPGPSASEHSAVMGTPHLTPSRAPSNSSPQTSWFSEPATTNVWAFKMGGGAVRLETTDELPFALWRKLRDYVEVIKPSNPQEDQ